MQQPLQPNQLYQTLPRPVTPLINRITELAEILRLLADPACQLLTIVGPGGVGKTRLALEAAQQILDLRFAILDLDTPPRVIERDNPKSKIQNPKFKDGIFYIDLQPVNSVAHLVEALVEKLGLGLDSQNAETRLLNFLRDKELLLLLDNFEHLVEQGSTFLTTILTAAPACKALVTSRAVLNLWEEWLYPLQGLDYPTHESAVELEDYSAMQLFVTHAQRVRPSFSWKEEEADVIRICQLVEGLPLALELAATWTKTLTCREIADEICRNLDFLTTNLRNMPVRQRSIQAIFAHSWALLTTDEQQLFAQLALCRGGFTRQAAEGVANSTGRPTLSLLAALVDQSLVRVAADGRYRVHELLRQYAQEQLKRQPVALATALKRHAHYFLHLLQERRLALTNEQQRRALEEITLELENVRAAWQWAVAQADIIAIQGAAFSYYMVCDLQGRYQEGVTAMTAALAMLADLEPTIQVQAVQAELSVWLGWSLIRLGQLDEAKAAFNQSKAIYKAWAIVPAPGFGTDPVLGLGLLATIQGHYPEAMTLAQAGVTQAQARNDWLNLQIAYYVLENATLAQGEYAEAKVYAQQAYQLTQVAGNQWMSAYILSDLGKIACAEGQPEQARQHYQASYAIKAALNDPEGMAAALIQLGNIALQQAVYADAESMFQQAHTFYTQINDRGGLAKALNGLAALALLQSDYVTAGQRFQQAMQIALEMAFTPLLLEILQGVGGLFIACDLTDLGLTLWSLVLHHPASEHGAKEQVRQELEAQQAQVSTARFTTAMQRGAATELEAIVHYVQTELATLPSKVGKRLAEKPLMNGPMVTAAAQSVHAPELVEQLTSREYEVLQLIAQGMTNLEIAEALIISPGTVKWYTNAIYGKLSVASRTQAVAAARKLRLLEV